MRMASPELWSAQCGFRTCSKHSNKVESSTQTIKTSLAYSLNLRRQTASELRTTLAIFLGAVLGALLTHRAGSCKDSM